MKEVRTTTIGLTGNIASGKSHIAEIFKSLGAVIANSDIAAHEAMNGEAFAKIAAAFPAAIEHGKINRQLLGREVFADEEKLIKLEKILHPLVRKKNLEFITANQGKLIVLEIPLLFEAEANEICDYTVFIHVSRETQLSRALARPGLNPEKLEKIITRQTKIPIAEKMRRADFIINNNPDDDAAKQVKKILIALKRRARP